VLSITPYLFPIPAAAAAAAPPTSKRNWALGTQKMHASSLIAPRRFEFVLRQVLIIAREMARLRRQKVEYHQVLWSVRCHSLAVYFECAD